MSYHHDQHVSATQVQAPLSTSQPLSTPLPRCAAVDIDLLHTSVQSERNAYTRTHLSTNTPHTVRQMSTTYGTTLTYLLPMTDSHTPTLPLTPSIVPTMESRVETYSLKVTEQHATRHVTGHIGDEFCRRINCQPPVPTDRLQLEPFISGLMNGCNCST